MLNATGFSQLSLIGHSQGTIQSFAAFALDATDSPYAGAARGISSKVNLFTAMGPVAGVGNQKSLLLSILVDIDFINVLNFFGEKQVCCVPCVHPLPSLSYLPCGISFSPVTLSLRS